MKFGRLSNVDDVDFSLPLVKDARLGWRSGATTVPAHSKSFRLFVGAPVWSHKGFLGKIYPPKTKPGDYLEHYARNFNCIELNSTFYGVPKAERIQRWCEQVGPEFRFCPKATRDITHSFGALPRTELAAFFRAIEGFGDNLGSCFFQFPPEFGPTQWRHLRDLLRLFPKEIQTAVELRHPGWFETPSALAWLLELGVETNNLIVISDTAGRRDVLHFCVPHPHLFVRFSGDALAESDFTRLDAWIAAMRELQEQGLSESYFFLHQESEDNCVELVEYLAEKMPEAQIPTVSRVRVREQLDLW